MIQVLRYNDMRNDGHPDIQVSRSYLRWTTWHWGRCSLRISVVYCQYHSTITLYLGSIHLLLVLFNLSSRRCHEVIHASHLF